jgi:hypothetical protein
MTVEKVKPNCQWMDCTKLAQPEYQMVRQKTRSKEQTDHEEECREANRWEPLITEKNCQCWNQRNLVQWIETEHFCQKHYRLKKWGCAKCASAGEHFDPQGECWKSRQPKKVTWQYTNNPDLEAISKAKLKNAIRRDLDLLQELRREIEASFAMVDVAEDTSWWDADLAGDLLTGWEKVQRIITSENGLNDKLEHWSIWQEEAEENWED